MRALLALFGFLILIGSPAPAQEQALRFQPAGDRLFDFNTGAVRGQLRGNGKYQGVSSLVDLKTGKELTRSAGVFSFYRVLSSDRRWGDSARDWPMSARLLPDGAVQIDWTPEDDHPLEITAVYRWKSPGVLDLETTVRPQAEMPRFEMFLSSYFDLKMKAFAYAKPMRPGQGQAGFLAAEASPLVLGSYLAFPIDRASAQMFFDRRWAPENGFVPWSVSRMLEAPIAIKRDTESDASLLLMSRPEDCFAVNMSYNLDPPDNIAGHGSIYMSLFGDDLAAGQAARARVRLVLEHNLSDQRAVQLYTQYLAESP